MRDHIVVMDAGTGYIKVGFANHTTPIFHQRCMSAKKSHQTTSPDRKNTVQTYTSMYCDEAAQWCLNDSEVECFYPKFDAISKKNVAADVFPIWSHAIHKLNINPKDYSLIMSTSSVGDDGTIYQKLIWALNVENFREVMFVHDSFAALTAYDVENALVIDVGEASSRLFAVSDVAGVDAFTNLSTDLSGHVTTLYLKELIKSLHHPSLDLETSIVDNIKKSISHTRIDKHTGIDHTETIHLKLPQNNNQIDLNLAAEGYMLPEIFFDTMVFSYYMPGLTLTLNTQSLASLIQKFMEKCPLLLKSKFISNIIIIGGTCNCDLFVERFFQHLEYSFTEPLRGQLNIINQDEHNPKDYDIQIFKGLSILAPKIKPEAWINRVQYLSSSQNEITEVALYNALYTILYI